MMQTIERPISDFTFPAREIVPTGWAMEEQKDPSQIAKDHFALWTKSIAMNAELFKKHVYENENLGELDLRQHRARLHAMIAFGENLAFDFLQLKDPRATEAHVPFIDTQLAQLRGTLEEWHGPIESDPNIPETFKQATREVLAGQLEDFEDDMIADNGAEASV